MDAFAPADIARPVEPRGAAKASGPRFATGERTIVDKVLAIGETVLVGIVSRFGSVQARRATR